MGFYITSRALQWARLAFFAALFIFVLGLRGCVQLVQHPHAPAVCVVPAPAFTPVVWRSLPAPSLERKRLPENDSSRPGPRVRWRGFSGSAYHVGPWARPVKVARDSAGRVITQRPPHAQPTTL